MRYGTAWKPGTCAVAALLAAVLPFSTASAAVPHFTYGVPGSTATIDAAVVGWSEGMPSAIRLVGPDGQIEDVALDPALVRGTTISTVGVDADGWTYGTARVPANDGTHSYEIRYREGAGVRDLEFRPIGSLDPPIRVNALPIVIGIVAAIGAAVGACALAANEHREDCQAQCDSLTCGAGQTKDCTQNSGGCGMIGASCSTSCSGGTQCLCEGQPLCDCG